MMRVYKNYNDFIGLYRYLINLFIDKCNHVRVDLHATVC